MKLLPLSVLSVAACLFFGRAAHAQVLFDATPTVKVESSGDTTARYILARTEQTKCSVRIVKRDGGYFWASRENKELVHRISGAFHYFIAVDGAGYVKILDTHSGPESLRHPGPRYKYLEQLSLGLTTITYWGESKLEGDISE